MVKIQEFTTKNPLTLIGLEAGTCWGTNTSDNEKNVKRAIDCIKSGHGRTLEFPDIYLTIDGYSAKCIRELYTHIGGLPTRLQASTRYIDYAKQFNTVMPESVKKNSEAVEIWEKACGEISAAMNDLKVLGIPKEDYTNLLPLAYETKMVLKLNLRSLANICEVRLCSRAYWEIRQLVMSILAALREYSPEWKTLIDDTDLLKVKCEKTGFCTETYGCGRKPKKDW